MGSSQLQRNSDYLYPGRSAGRNRSGCRARNYFKGIVKSISRATGASFSLLPQDNSAGNFVKVEQRVPIRIEFSTGNRPEDMERLRAGMNVECVVND